MPYSLRIDQLQLVAVVPPAEGRGAVSPERILGTGRLVTCPARIGPEHDLPLGTTVQLPATLSMNESAIVPVVLYTVRAADATNDGVAERDRGEARVCAGSAVPWPAAVAPDDEPVLADQRTRAPPWLATAAVMLVLTSTVYTVRGAPWGHT